MPRVMVYTGTGDAEAEALNMPAPEDVASGLVYGDGGDYQGKMYVPEGSVTVNVEQA